MSENKSVFDILNAIDASDKTKTKNKLSYLSWPYVWAEVKKKFPDASFKVYPQTLPDGNTRFWHDDGRTGWVEVGVTIQGTEIIETLAIMDYRNASIPAEKITSVDANKSMKRCLVKACALHGLGLYIYMGEDIPEESAKTIELKTRIKSLVAKKCAQSDAAKEKVAELCKAAEKQAFPEIEDDLIRGDYNNIDDIDILTKLEKQLMAVRK